jgi:predicted AAA+ superfamily ATPase
MLIAGAVHDDLRKYDRRDRGVAPVLDDWRAQIGLMIFLFKSPQYFLDHRWGREMAVANRDRVGRALELLRAGLYPYVDRTMRARKGAAWAHEFNDRGQLRRLPDGTVNLDTPTLLKAMERYWGEVFSDALDRAHRSLVNELIDIRNKWAHDHPFSSADTLRALDSAKRLLEAVSAKGEAEEIGRTHYEVMRTLFEEEARNKTRYKPLLVEGEPKAGLKSWREIATPHPDVASGRYAQAEFMADLAQVYRGEGADEYRDATEFYRRTFLTQGLRRLLANAMLRLVGRGGDPVVELQTNFGGGKTHSLLALYHLTGHPSPASLPGVDGLMHELGLGALPRAQRAVLVGTALSPGQPKEHENGVTTRTLWGELAHGLGGAEGYALVARSDETGTSPGSDVLFDLLKRYAPCLVLLDEWVAFVRQLYHVAGAPAGSFEANLTFAQALSEAAKAVPNALLVASLPASQIEIGGEGGQEALTRLKNTFGRIEASWQPATADEGFEIVRRRLFEPLLDRDAAANRDAVIRAFSEVYRRGKGEFPQGCGESEYERRMRAAYPIHPELFERLYNDWGGLDKFQRTRGVLRFIAATIHVLWERNDAGLLILPSSIPLDSPVVGQELVRYLDHNWSAVLAKDVDGATSVPLAIDQEIPALGRYSATRRVARTVWMGSAPTYEAGKNPGLDDRRIKLGCAQPGESAGNFGDALRRLADRATYLYQDGSRYWFSTQPSVARLADDRAAQYEAADIEAEIVKRLKTNEARPKRGDFTGVHAAPANSAEVGDEAETRLVILGPAYPHSAKGDGSRAIEAAQNILFWRGSAQRNYRNALVFLAANQQRLPQLEEAVRLSKAWTSIVSESEALNLDPFQKRQAESKAKEFDATVEARLFEAWCWTLAPFQPDANNPAIEWDAERVQGNESLAARAGRRLANKEAFFTHIGPARINMALGEWLWRDQKHLSTRQLWDWLATYLYLPRLRDAEVLRRAIEDAISGLVNDTFAYAERYDEERQRYVGLRATGGGWVIIDSQSVIVKTDVALAQLAADKRAAEEKTAEEKAVTHEKVTEGEQAPETPKPTPPKIVRRYAASVALNPDRPSRDMGRVAEEVLAHLSTLPRAKLRITVEIDAEIPDGVPEEIQRIVLENGTALKFKSQDFEPT